MKQFVSKHLALLLVLIYVAFVAVFMLSHDMWFSPDQFFIVVLIAMFLLGRSKQFISDWGPFLFLVFGYEFLRSLIPHLTSSVHIFPMIRIDEKLFGSLPTITLQSALFNPTSLHWYDYVSVILYIGHFVSPMFVGLFFWLVDRSYFKKFSHGFLLLSYAAFITYLIFPAMPPWMASNKGYIPPLQEITGVVLKHFWHGYSLPSLSSIFGGNPVAAMPSLHAAWPSIIFLFFVEKYRRFGWLLLPYVLMVGFSVVYLGEHYAVDVLVGMLYALLAFLVVMKRHKLAALPLFARTKAISS